MSPTCCRRGVNSFIVELWEPILRFRRPIRGGFPGGVGSGGVRRLRRTRPPATVHSALRAEVVGRNRS